MAQARPQPYNPMMMDAAENYKERKKNKFRPAPEVKAAMQAGQTPPNPAAMQGGSSLAQMRELANKQAQERYAQERANRPQAEQFAEGIVNKRMQGLYPEEKQAISDDSRFKIDRAVQVQQNQLRAQQARRGQGAGAAFAQEKELNRLGNEAGNQAQRDLVQMDADMARKNLANFFAISEGELGKQDLYSREALEDLQHEEDQKRRQKFEDEIARILSKIG